MKSQIDLMVMKVMITFVVKFGCHKQAPQAPASSFSILHPAEKHNWNLPFKIQDKMCRIAGLVKKWNFHC